MFVHVYIIYIHFCVNEMGIWILWIGCVASRSNFVCTNPCRTHKLDHDDGSLDGVGHACSWLTTSKYSSICLCSNSIDTQCKSAGFAFFFVRTLALVATIYAWWCASAMTLNQMQLLFHEIFWYWSLDWLFGESVKNDFPTDESDFLTVYAARTSYTSIVIST